MSIFAFRPKPAQLFINQPIKLILSALSGCSLVQKYTSVCVLGILYKVHIGRNHAGSGKSPLCSGASQFAAGYAADRLWTGPPGDNLRRKCSPLFPLTIDVWKRKGRGWSAARQDITAETPVNFGTNEHTNKAAKILITYWAIDYYADFNSLSNMLTPIKN